MAYFSSAQPGDSTPRPLPDPAEASRGEHTLRKHQGTVVGIFGSDVFVDLGPRLQGVLPVTAFPDPPREGDVHEFTMRGREESLWVLDLAGERSLPTWQGMQEGQWVSARVVREHQGHLQLKIDGLHAVMPSTHTGKSPGQSLRGLVGKNLVCEVLEVDEERQRVVLSRKSVLKKQREARSRRMQLLPGDVTRGKVVRIESYGAFLRLNGGREGLLHISDMSHQRIDHPSDRLELGQDLEVKVLRLSHGGKRISLGLKQLIGNPWRAFARSHPLGSLLVGSVNLLEDAGLRVHVGEDLTGWVPRGETPFGHRRLGVFLRSGQSLALRVVDISVEDQELVLSMLDTGGRPLALEECEALDNWREQKATQAVNEPAAETQGTSLGRQLREAMQRKRNA